MTKLSLSYSSMPETMVATALNDWLEEGTTPRKIIARVDTSARMRLLEARALDVAFTLLREGSISIITVPHAQHPNQVTYIAERVA